jgi:hypothetical protein
MCVSRALTDSSTASASTRIVDGLGKVRERDSKRTGDLRDGPRFGIAPKSDWEESSGVVPYLLELGAVGALGWHARRSTSSVAQAGSN